MHSAIHFLITYSSLGRARAQNHLERPCAGKNAKLIVVSGFMTAEILGQRIHNSVNSTCIMYIIVHVCKLYMNIYAQHSNFTHITCLYVFVQYMQWLICIMYLKLSS